MSPPMDVLWFDLPLGEGDGSLHPLSLRVGDGTMLVHVHRGDHWQLGCVIAKGSYRELKAAGLDALRADIVRLVPPFGTRIDLIDDWKQMAVLSVSVGRIERWHKPGLLCIGDAAHVMSPVGGVGINYAVKDAVAAANLLTDPLKAGTLGDSDLARVQARREFPTKLIQGVQTLIQKRVIKAALKGGSFRIPLLMRILGRTPLLRRLPARLIGR
jgi:2-polyprenyl-6-methoxyphenol hydroxylase-like FAD-dependent oxidoreductase